MRTPLIALILALSATLAQAQDDASALAAQQATAQAQADALQASQQMQQFMQQTQSEIDAQNAADPPAAPVPAPALAAKPKFSLKQGKYLRPETVKITDSTRGAIIYYTTDGWTPTKSSSRYRGPVTINSTTTLQAIAIAPYYQRSIVASARYTFNTPATQNLPAAAPTGTEQIRRHIPVPLVFSSSVSSKTASVGDKISLTLADELKVGDLTVASKGSSATAIVTAVDKTGIGGAPGVVTFEAESLNANGKVIQLRGGATLEGEAKPPNAAILIPYAGFLTVLKHGKDAVIAPGTAFTAYISSKALAAGPD
ncbi:MAG TPA: chitobiase/beta-hexosaminidase C-terminal domain-containing protein [Candidatus Acidoferrales bacterium]|nr:chitobiase/beta-hexosaminidase C-terminal domain-containing protein [Candidatus Acidoferrales bacterium]